MFLPELISLGTELEYHKSSETQAICGGCENDALVGELILEIRNLPLRSYYEGLEFFLTRFGGLSAEEGLQLV